MKKIALPALIFALTAVFTQSAFAWGMPTCNINNANSTTCKNKVLYRCRLFGRGSTDPDSGSWEKIGTCEQTGEADSLVAPASDEQE